MSNRIPPETLPSLVREFASYKTAIQGCSQKTADEYLLDLRTFLRYRRLQQQHHTKSATTLLQQYSSMLHQHAKMASLI